MNQYNPPFPNSLPYESKTHCQLIQDIEQNAKFRNIVVNKIDADDLLQQIYRFNHNIVKLCIDGYSMLTYCIKSHKVFSDAVQKFNQQPSKDVIQQCAKYVNYVLHCINQLLLPDIIVIVFPDKSDKIYHSTCSRTKKDSNYQILANLLNTKFKQQKQEYNRDIRQDPNWKFMESVFSSLQYSLHNPFEINNLSWCNFSQQSKQNLNLKQRNKNVVKIINKLRCPTLDNYLFKQDPCFAQLLWYAGLRYTCLTWTHQAISYLPIGTYVLGIKIQDFIEISLFEEKINILQRQIWMNSNKMENNKTPIIDRIQINEESQIILSQQTMQDQLNNLKQAIKETQMQIFTNFKRSQTIFYNFSYFMYVAKNSNIDTTYFRTDQVILTVLSRFSEYYQYTREILTQVRQGKYQLCQWQIKKILVIYLLIQLHPVAQFNYQVSCQVKYPQKFANGYMIIYESDLEGYAFEETKMILAKYINKAIFVHRLFQPYIDLFIPKIRQARENTRKDQRMNENIDSSNILASNTANKHNRQQSTKSRTKNIENDGTNRKNMYIDEQTKKKITKQLFPRYVQITKLSKYQQGNRFREPVEQDQSDIEQDY